ncbi:MAG: NUDIX domain-containing protein [Candidatus ainarchaeum sp.]|nr:NUDIX domain-containing protein [Candidatus ainarchaeum sp.]
MDYISYFSAFEKIKETLMNNRLDFSSANVLYNEINLNKLKLLIVLSENNTKEKIKTLLKTVKEPLELIFVKDKDLNKYLSKKSPQKLLDELTQLWHIAGFGISKNYFEIITEKNAGNLIYSRKILNRQELLEKASDFCIRNGAGALLYNPNLKKFLLLRHNLEDEVYWNIPKGGTEEGETTTETVKREIMEETGITNYDLKNEYFVTMHTYVSKGGLRKAYVTHFAATTKEKKLKLSDEHIAYKWLSFNGLLKQAHFPNQKWVYYKLGKYLQKINNKT